VGVVLHVGNGQRGRVAGKQDPVRFGKGAARDEWRNLKRIEMEFACDSGKDWAEIQGVVADVNRDDRFW